MSGWAWHVNRLVSFVISRGITVTACSLDNQDINCSILNNVARLIYGGGKCDHIISLLRDKLHRLRVPQRVQYKSWLMVHKVLHGSAPAYTTDFVPEFRQLNVIRHFATWREAATNSSFEDRQDLLNIRSLLQVHQPGSLCRTSSSQLHPLRLSK